MEKKPLKGWAVDGATSGNPGPSKYRCIDIETGKIVFSHDDIGHATNNITEFIALVHAIAEATQRDKPVVIYSDSQTAIAWMKKKEHKSTLKRNDENSVACDKLDRCIQYLQNTTFSNLETGAIKLNHIHVAKWITKDWGENPADYGNKSK